MDKECETDQEQHYPERNGENQQTGSGVGEQTVSASSSRQRERDTPEKPPQNLVKPVAEQACAAAGVEYGEENIYKCYQHEPYAEKLSELHRSYDP